MIMVAMSDACQVESVLTNGPSRPKLRTSSDKIPL